MFNFLRKRKLKPEPPMSLIFARQVCETAKFNRESSVRLRDSDGNLVRLRYSNGAVERAALAASKARDLENSIDEIERVLRSEEERFSDGLRTS